MPLKWNADMSVGVKTFDQQHQQFLEILNNLYDKSVNEISFDELQNAIGSVARFATEHFSTEESYFDKYNYPQSEEHKRLHVALVKRVKEFKDKKFPTAADGAFEIIDFLEDWLVTHMEDADRDYIEFFQKLGVTD
ncbi:bacteriohemerythrin [Candidatus Dojkabacteria bacterium]|nr:bacteriohemerythrin [Candidatus Dojkabacteria bacterium]